LVRIGTSATRLTGTEISSKVAVDEPLGMTMDATRDVGTNARAPELRRVTSKAP
jgi:hypothetical protein